MAETHRYGREGGQVDPSAMTDPWAALAHFAGSPDVPYPDSIPSVLPTPTSRKLSSHTLSTLDIQEDQHNRHSRQLLKAQRKALGDETFTPNLLKESMPPPETFDDPSHPIALTFPIKTLPEYFRAQ